MAEQVVKVINERLLLHRDVLEEIVGPHRNKKVYVVGIAGANRTGKSYLLNFFVKKLKQVEEGRPTDDFFDEGSELNEFEFRAGDDRHTTGIHIYGRPFLLKAANGEEVVVLLMDTQGTFDDYSSTNLTTKIFALATLLSTVQIFNLMNKLQADSIQHLALFTEYAQLATSKNLETKLFQLLLFLIRDWNNVRDFKFGFNGGKNLLKRRFRNNAQTAPELRRIWETLEKTFERIECFLMSDPGKAVKQGDSRTVGELEEEFSNCLKELIPHLFNQQYVSPKTINGEEITCGELIDYFDKYVKLFNSEELPDAKNVYEAGVELRMKHGLEKAKNAYDVVFMLEPVPQTLLNLKLLHEKAKSSAMKQLVESIIRKEERVEKELEKYMQDQYNKKFRIIGGLQKSSEEAMKKQQAVFEERERKIKKEAEEQLEKLKKQNNDSNKTLHKVLDAIGSGLGALGSGLNVANTAMDRYKSNGNSKTSESSETAFTSNAPGQSSSTSSATFTSTVGQGTINWGRELRDAAMEPLFP